MAAPFDPLAVLLAGAPAPSTPATAPVTPAQHYAGPVNRWFLRCEDCLSVLAVETEPRRSCEARFPGADVPARCGACAGRLVLMGRVQADRLIRHDDRTACDARCQAAAGPNCACQCGGANHGQAVSVLVTIDAGGVPRVTPRDPAKALLVAEEWRAALATVREAFATDGSWLPRHVWERNQELRRIAGAARAKKTHKGRMAAIRVALDMITPARVAP